MMLRRNLIANSINQATAFSLNIVAVPLYLSLLGAAQYGLVGFALIVQMWVNLLDVGMSGTLSREMTRLKIGAESENEVNSFLRSLDLIFIASGMGIIVAAIVSRDWWAQNWFGDTVLPAEMVSQSVFLIAALSAARLLALLYRGGVMGLERQVFGSTVGIVSALARLFLPLPFILRDGDVRLLFAAWLLISIIETLVLRRELAKAFSASLGFAHFSWNALRRRAGLWSGVAFLSLIWTLITQADKVVLSKELSLAQFGEYTVVTVLSTAILTIPTPIVLAYQPRLIAAVESGDLVQIRRLMADAAQLILLFAVVPALALAATPFNAVIGWTGNPAVARAITDYAAPYLLGSAVVAFAPLIYAVQFAHGNLRLLLRANILSAVFLVPAVIYVADAYGARGAALLWLAMAALWLLAYYPIALVRFCGLQIADFAKIGAAIVLLVAGTLAVAHIWPVRALREEALLWSVGAGAVQFAIAALVLLGLRSTMQAYRKSG